MSLKPVAINIDDRGLVHAKELGAVETVNSRDANFAQKVREASGGLGVAAAAVFSAAQPAYLSALQIIAPGGLLMIAGIVGAASINP